MGSLTKIAALAALAAHVDALCMDKGSFVCNSSDLTATVETAVETYAGDY